MKIKLNTIIILAIQFLPLTLLAEEKVKEVQKLTAKHQDSKNKQPKKKNIFADAENLKILPENTSPEQLRETMKSFSMALGLRCNNCHVGEPGKPLQSYDFASDEKKLKTKARVMIKMVSNINGEQLTKLDEIEKDARVEVRCMTCHRGQQKPELIQNVLADELAKSDINGVIKKYSDLRKEYYGSHTFDFGEYVLPMFAGDYLKGGSANQNTVALLEVNEEHYPNSYYGVISLATAYHKSGDKNKAKLGYEKALKLNPKKAVFIKQRLKELEEKK